MSDGYRGRGSICMNPLGPHFYVDPDEGERPLSMVDLVTDRMNQLLNELDDEHGWPITKEHIYGHAPIVMVEWSPDESKSHNVDVNIDPISVSQSWYSKRKLREYNYDDSSKRDIVTLK